MVAIFTGAGLGFERGSGAVLGTRGQIGSGALGNGGGSVAVNAATGSLTLQRTDEMLIGRGPDAAPSLTYGGGPSTPVQWSADHLRILLNLTGTANTAGSTITMSRGFNDRPVLTYDTGRGAYVYKEGGGSYDEVRYANGIWSVVDGDTQTTEYYEAYTGGAFLRKRVVDRDGNEQTYTYNPGTAEVSRITNADGGYMEMTYTLGRPNEITTYAAAGGPAQTRVRYQWDPAVSSRLLSVTVDLSPADNSIADGKTYVTTYGYETSTSRLITSITQTDGSSLAIGYDTSGRVTSLTELAAAGDTRVTTLAYHNGYTSVTDAQGGVTTLHYDAQNQLIQITLPPASAGAAAQTTGFAYNANGDVVSVTDAAGTVTLFQYDSNGNEISRQDSLGNLVTRTYGTRNELLTETRSEAPALTFATNGAVPTMTGNKILGSADNAWGSATSLQSYTGGAIVAGRRNHPYNGYSLLGLTDTPLSASTPYADYDYAFYFYEDRIRIWENGALIDDPVASGATDNHYCQVEYDGAKVVYRINGAVVRTATTTGDRTFHAGVSTSWSGRGVQGVTFASSNPPLRFATSGAAPTISAGKVVGSADAVWGSATSLHAYAGSAYVAGRRHHPANGYSLMGLTDRPLATGASTAEYDYAFYFYEDRIRIWENGALIDDPVASGATDDHFCQIEYDGARVVYRINGAIVRDVAAAGGRSFHAGVSTLHSDRGVQDLAFATSAPVRAFATNGHAPRMTGDKILGAADAVWGSVTSPQTYTGSAYVAGRRHHPANGYSLIGLTDTPLATGTPTSEYDYAFYFYEDRIRIWENGALVDDPVASGATDDHYCQIEYDGAKVVYRINGAVVRTAATTGGRTFHAAVSTLYSDRGVQDFAFASSPPATTRFIHDSENHLRYVVGAEGGVTEYRYNGVGQQVAELVYTEHSADVAGLAASRNFTEAAMDAWVAWMPDKSAFKRTNTYYDARGQVSRVVSYSSLSKFGEGTESPLDVVPGANATVTQRPEGLYRITKMIGSDASWDADAHSLVKVEGDFVLQVRPGQTDKATIGGMAAAPAASASFTNLDYGFYFAANGTVCYMEKGLYSGIGTYAAGDAFWLERVGSTIHYYKGATLAAAKTAGALRTRAGAAGALYFDSSIYTTGGFLDAGLTPLDVVDGVNTTVTPQADGLYRVTKTGGGTWNWDGDARSTAKAEGDFVLRLRPGQNNLHMAGGVTTSPAANAAFTNLDFGFYFHGDGSLNYMEGGNWASLGVTYRTGDDFWLVRSGSTLRWYKGATLEIATAAGALRTRTGVSGTFYFDSSFNTTGAVMDVAFAPCPIVNGANMTVTPLDDGLQRIAKSGTVAEWDADARSTTRAEADFVLRLRPAQTGAYMMGGVSAAPGTSSNYNDLAYSFYFTSSGALHAVESGSDISLGTTYSPGDNFWLVRTGNSIGYYRGATLEAAMAAGALRTSAGVSGTFHFDSTVFTPGAAMDVAFTPAESAGGSAGASRTHYVYDPAGRLLSRVTDGQQAETFVYDGLGRMVASTDRNQGTTSIVFNDAANQTVVTLASGLVKTSTYNKAGDLISVAEGGSYVAAGTATSQYDKLGRLRITTDAAGFNKYFVYDKVGRLVAEVNHRGDLVEYRYDANDRLIATTRYTAAVTGANLALLADPNSAIEMPALRPASHHWDIWSWRTYDKEGRLTSTIDGTIRTYEYDKAGRLVKSVAYQNPLSWDQAVVFQASPPTSPFIPAAHPGDSVARNFYDEEGRLVAALDGEGYLTRSLYDRAGQLVETVAYATATAAADRASGTLSRLLADQPAHAEDRRTRFVYDGRGQLRFEVDALSQVTEYGYDGAGQRISTIRHSGSIAATTDYGYDNVKRLVAASRLPTSPPGRKSWNVYDGAGRLAYAIDPEGAVASYGYDSMGQVTKTVRFAAVRATASAPDLATMNGWAAAQSGNSANRVTRHYYSARGERRFTVDAEGYVTRTDFDAAGRTVGELRWDLPVSVSDATTIGGVDSACAGDWAGKGYTYDYGGALTEFRNGEGNRTVYADYNNGTRMREVVADADGAYTYFLHDMWGRLKSRIEANGTPESATVNYDYDGRGNLERVVDARNNATTRTFDHLGRVKTETDAAAGLVSYEYNAFGEVTKVTDARGNATISTYDKLGRLLSTTDALNNVTTYSYDDFGDLRTVTRGSAVTSFDYDLAGRVIKTTDAEGHYEAYGLNAFGDRITVRNKIGGTTVNAYDRRGLLASETLPMASVNAEGGLVASTVTNKFEYDSRGNRTKRIVAFGLAEARTTTWVYDKADRLTETRGDAVLAMDQGGFVNGSLVTPTEKLKYDARGRVIEKTDALGGRTLYYYDRMSRVTAEIGPTGTYSAFTYDANGNMLTRRIYGTAVALPGVAGGTPPSPPAGEYRQTGHTYDALNRLKTTSVALIRIGAWNGSQYESSAWATVTTTIDYDANGNVVRTVDGNNNASFTYYDKLNRKIAEVDREGYLTYLTLDGEGNVVWDQRYATPLSGVTTASDPNALRAAAGDARSTEFWYDRNGRRRFERRYGVQAYAVDPSTGALTGPTAAVAMIEYAYNGLGEVTRKTEANGDYVDYDYDQAGRLTRERRAPFVDNSNTWVRPTIDYSYDGLNALTRTRQGGESAGGTDRITRYYYGAGGRLGTMYDANGAYYQYYYDAAGNVVRESYYRYKWNNSYTLDSLLYTRDQLGRVTSQGLATWTGSAWDRGDTEMTAYNAYGDVAQRGLNNVWQEQFHYDSAGRLWKSNSGDGVWRFFLYDGAGNQTLTVESEGADLAYHSLEQVLALASANYNTYLGNAYIDGINVTIAQFDRRGQQVGTRLPFRQLAGSTMATLTSARSYNAYGEVTGETNTLGRTTNFLYNAMGRLIEKQSPFVDYTTESGATGNARPVEKYYHDVSGRLIATEDANGNRIARSLLAGTGHGGSEALVTAEFHPDTGVSRTWYDAFGDARRLVNEANEEETRLYDAMGRLTAQTHHGLTDHYGYDLLGQRLWHWNTLLGSGNLEYTNYDAQGRVTYQVTLGGDSTQTDYAWSSSLATYGMATYGGWTETTTYANGRQLIEQSDRFGRTLWKQDLGGHAFSSTYDQAGRLIQRSGPETLSWSYYNTGLAYGVDNGAGNYAHYGYDAAGNKTSETTVKAYAVVQNATATYDELGRLKSWAEAGGAVSPASSTSYRYDLVGNIRHTHSVQAMLDVHGASIHAPVVDYWYRYDAMNRVTTDKGVLSNGAIVGGTAYTYDAAGRRKTATSSVQRSQKLYRYVPAYGPSTPRYYDTFPSAWIDDGYGTTTYVDYYFTTAQVETYHYDGAGHLQSVAIAVQSLNPITDQYGTTSPTVGALGAAVTRAVYTHDAMGRVTFQSDYLENGTSVAYSRSVTYNAKGQVTDETVNTRQGTDTWTSVIHNEYGSGAAYVLGAAVTVTTSDSKNGYYQYATTTTNSFAWRDGAVQSSVSFAKTGQSTYTTSYTYSAGGALSSVYVADGRPRTITFTTDMLGQVIRRDEADNNYHATTGGDPHEVWYRFNGKQIAYAGNNGTFDTDYAASIAARAKAPVGTNAFRHGDWNGPAVGDYDPSLEHINSYSQGSAGGGYVVRAGDTLQGIALGLWGDASLWYKLAEANGLTAAAGLVEGRSLIVPHGVQANHHDASTLKPYDPAEVLGDASPTTPKPQKKGGKCGIFGQILLVAIAVAVSVVTYGALAPHMAGFAGAVLAGAASGVAGSIASQAFGVATGIQDKFSFKAVAMAAIAGGVSGGVGHLLGQAGVAGSKILTGVVRGAAGSALTQGIGVALGLQKKFDFAAVAAAGIGGGLASAIGGQPLERNNSFANHMTHAGAGAASAVANATVRSLVDGTDFGDNLIAALPDIIGSTIGNMVAHGVARTGPGSRSKPSFRGAELAPPEADAAELLARLPTVPPLDGGSTWSDGLQALFDGFPGGGATVVPASGDTIKVPVAGTGQLEEFTDGGETVDCLPDGTYWARIDGLAYKLLCQSPAGPSLLTMSAGELGRYVREGLGDIFDFEFPDIDFGGVYLGREGFEIEDLITARNGRYGLLGDNGFNLEDGNFSAFGENGVNINWDRLSLFSDDGININWGAGRTTLGGDNGAEINRYNLLLGEGGKYASIGAKHISAWGYDVYGSTYDFSKMADTISPQRQGRHLLGDRLYTDKSYVTSLSDAQAVLDAARSGRAQYLGMNKDGPVVRFHGVTGYNVNPRSGHPNQPTHVFYIKGTTSPSVVPTSPAWKPKR